MVQRTTSSKNLTRIIVAWATFLVRCPIFWHQEIPTHALVLSYDPHQEPSINHRTPSNGPIVPRTTSTPARSQKKEKKKKKKKKRKKKSQKVTRREYSFGEVRAWQRRCRACGEKHGKPRGHTWNNPESHRSSGRSHPDVPWVSSARHRVICGTRVYSFLFIPLFIPCGSSRDTSAHRHEESLVATARMR